MPAATSNRLLPILGGAVVLMLAFVTLKSCSQEEDSGVVLDNVPTAPAPRIAILVMWCLLNGVSRRNTPCVVINLIDTWHDEHQSQ